MNIKAFLSLPVIAYIALVVAVNVAFSYVPMIDLGPTFGMLSPVAFAVGFVFVIRDFAQRAVGHNVLFAMAVAAVLSYLLADPYVATASIAAFVASELADWAIFTVTRKPFKDRILISSMISTPIDTAVFLTAIAVMSLGTFLVMVASKMVAALVVYAYYQLRGATGDAVPA